MLSTLGAADRLGLDLSRPFRLDTPVTATMVLTARSSSYTLDELVRLSPRSVTRSPDGGIEILEHIVVSQGATLLITSSEAENVRLRSGAEGFASIVAAGGSLSARGEPERPVLLASWDPATDAADEVTDDGRAYIRVFGGRAEFVNVTIEHLGFWGGITGGLSFTGTEIPTVEVGSEQLAQESALADAAGVDVLPLESELETLELIGEELDLGYASGLVQSVTLVGNAFGIFVTASDQVEIRDTLVQASLVDGIVFHRDVTNSAVISTVTRGNGRDGIRVARATSSVLMDRLDSSGNGRNGVTLDGGAIVDGPSAIGMAVRVSGDNVLTGSTASDNGRAGIAVVDGVNIELRGNTVARNGIGIVVSKGASSVQIVDNEVSDHPAQAIALRDAGSDLVLRDNRIDGATTGIMVRDSVGVYESNTITGVTNHGVTLIGDTGNSVIVDNRIAGAGPSPIDVIRTNGAAVRGNEVTDWRSTKPLSVVLASMFQPLTILWIGIGLFILLGLAYGARRRRRGIHDPFADRRPLATMTRGIVPRESIEST